MSKLSKWLKKEQETSILEQVKCLKTADPGEGWDLYEEIGDGNFGTVYKVFLIQSDLNMNFNSLYRMVK